MDKTPSGFNATSNNATSLLISKVNLPLGLTIALIALLILLENSLILLTLRLYKKWKVVDLLVLSLSLADFINAALPIHVLNTKAHFLISPWPTWLCDLFVWATYTLRLASLCTVTLMSVEQALLLNQPLRHYTQMTVSFMRKLILVIWGLSAIAAVFPKLHQRSEDAGSTRCRYQPFQLGFAFAVFIETFGFAQFGIVLGSYVALVLSSKGFVRRQRTMMESQRRRQMSHEKENVTSTKTKQENQKDMRETQGMLQARQLCRVMGYVVLLYYISWLPFLIYNLYQLLRRSTEYNVKMGTIVGVCSLAIPVVNPILYVKMVNRYRKGVIFILRQMTSVCGRNKQLNSTHDKKQSFSLNVIRSYSTTSSTRFVRSSRTENAAATTKFSTTTLALCELDETT